MDSADSPSDHVQGGSYDPFNSPPFAPTTFPPHHPPDPTLPITTLLITTPLNTMQQSTSPQHPRRMATLVRVDSDIAEAVYNGPNTSNNRVHHSNLNNQHLIELTDHRHHHTMSHSDSGSLPRGGALFATTAAQAGHQQVDANAAPVNDYVNDDGTNDRATGAYQAKPLPSKLTEALVECINDPAVASINWNSDGTHVVFTDGEAAAKAIRRAFHGSFDFRGSTPTWTKLKKQLYGYHFERVGQTTTPHPGHPVKLNHPCFKRDTPQLYHFVRYNHPPPTAFSPNALTGGLDDDDAAGAAAAAAAAADDDDDGDNGDDDDNGDDTNDNATQTKRPTAGKFFQVLLECINDPTVDSINWDNDGTCVVITDGEAAAPAVRNAYHGSVDFKGSEPTWDKLDKQLRGHAFKRSGQHHTPRPGLPLKYRHYRFKRDSPRLSSLVQCDSVSRTHQATPTSAKFVQALLECVNDPAIESINWDRQGTAVVITEGENAAQAVRNAFHGSFNFKGSEPTWDKLDKQLRGYSFRRGQPHKFTPHPGLPLKFSHSFFKRDSPELYPLVQSTKRSPFVPSARPGEDDADGAAAAAAADDDDGDDDDDDNGNDNLDTNADEGGDTQTTPSPQYHIPTTSPRPRSSSTATKSQVRRRRRVRPMKTRRPLWTIHNRPTLSVPTNSMGSDAMNYNLADDASNDIHHVRSKQRQNGPVTNPAALSQRLVQIAPIAPISSSISTSTTSTTPTFNTAPTSTTQPLTFHPSPHKRNLQSQQHQQSQ